MEPAVVYGYWPCFSEGNDLVVLDARTGPTSSPASRSRASTATGSCAWPTSSAPRSRGARRDRASTWSPWGPGQRGDRRAVRGDAYRDYLELHGLSVQLTEALAEYWHARVRVRAGLRGRGLRRHGRGPRQGYRGSRYSFGYPACPDLEDRASWSAAPAGADRRQACEELQLHPEQSTDALVVHHPEAKYFNAR